jgi:hypothetical protein
MKSPDAKALVQAHRKNIFITVGSDEILTDGLPDGLSDRDFGTLEDIMGAEYLAPKHQINTSFHWLFIAQLFASHIANMTKPDLIPWCQSDQLLTPDQFDLQKDPRAMSV